MEFNKTSKNRSPLSMALLAGLLATSILGVPGSAYALDALDFFKSIQAQAEKNGQSIKFGSLEKFGEDGARGLNIEIIDTKKGNTATIAQLSLSGVNLIGENGYAFDQMQASDIQIISTKENDKTSTLSIGDINFSGFNYPDVKDRISSFWPLDISNGTLSNIKIVSSGSESVSFDIPEITINALAHQGNTKFTLGNFDLQPGSGSFAKSDGNNGSFTFGGLNILDVAKTGEYLVGLKIGSVKMGPIRFNGVNEKNQKIAFSFEGMDGVNLANPDFSAPVDEVFPIDGLKANVQAGSFSLDGKELFSFGGATTSANFDKENGIYNADVNMGSLFFNVKEFPSQPGKNSGKQQFAALGYDSIDLNIEIDMSWDINKGILSLPKYKISAKDMAAFDTQMKLDGYTKEVAGKLQNISNKMNFEENNEMKQALAMQMLAEMSSLAIGELKFVIEDASLTKRILKMQAEKSGQTAEDMAGALPFMAGAMLSQFEIPDFAASLSAAIGTYLTSSLNSGGSITLAAAPEEPISFAEIMGIAAGVKAGNIKPAEIIERFKISVDAK